MWVCYSLILWLGSVNREESLYCREQIINLTLFRKYGAAMSLCNIANCSKARLTLSYLNAIFYLRMCFSRISLKHSTSAFNIALILNQLLKIVVLLTDELMSQWEAAEELLATGVSITAVWGFSSRVWYFYRNLKIDNRLRTIVPCHMSKPQKRRAVTSA